MCSSDLKTPILYLCGASSETFPWAARYAQWVIVLGGPFTVMNTLLANLVRAEGGANYASIGVSFGGLLNLLLDPLLILPSFLELADGKYKAQAMRGRKRGGGGSLRTDEEIHDACQGQPGICGKRAYDRSVCGAD